MFATRLWAFWLFMGLAHWGFAQSITRVEYFIDTDPGYGAAIPVQTTGGSTLTATFAVTIATNLPAGLHRLYIRAKNEANQWSMVGTRYFVNEALPAGTALVQAEYFIDTDPGYGAATAIAIPNSVSAISQNLTITIPQSLSTGLHQLFVRVKTMDGRWSVVGSRSFINENIVPTAEINYLEYFVDTDPGPGNATSIQTYSDANIPGLMIQIPASSGVGLHKLFIRARNTAGQWSLVGIREFNNQANVVKIVTAPVDWCRNIPLSLSYVASGSYAQGNVFQVQLSDLSGSFVSPTLVGSVTATGSGTVSITLPNSLSLGIGYRLRVVSTNPAESNMPAIPLAIVTNCCTVMTTIRSGNWTDPGIWSCNRVPQASDAAHIGHSVTLPAKGRGFAKQLLFSPEGKLIHESNAKLRVGW